MEDIVEKIEQIYPELSKSQQRVANYIYKSYREIAFLSVSSLAKEIGVSDTTIIRFCKELGYEGYSDFKKCIKIKVHSEISTVNRLEKGQQNGNNNYSLFQKVFNHDIENIQKTLDTSSNLENFDVLIELLGSAKHVYIIGVRSSAPLAIFLGYALKYIQKNVSFIIPGIGNMLDEITAINSDDLVISIAFSRYTKQTVETMGYLKNKGVKIVLITDTSLSSITKNTDLVFSCVVDSNTYFDSFTSCIALFNTILTAMAIQHEDEVKKSLIEMENLFELFDTFLL